MAALKLDTIDLRILAEVQREGRVTKLALAERVGLSPTPCWTRLRRLETAGLISGYHAHLSLKPLGMATVFVEVTLSSHRQADFDRFEKTVAALDEVAGCWAVGGGIDYLMKVVTRDIDSYQRLVDALLAREIGIDRYFTYIVTKAVKDEAAVPVEMLLGATAD